MSDERKSRIAINRVYTRTGDNGRTSLVDGTRVEKDAPRIEAYGTVDELNACLGMVLVEVARARQPMVSDRLEPELLRIQNELFDLGSELATPSGAFVSGMPAVDAGQITAMERLMDVCNEDLEPLRSFVLPGGGAVSAALHVARTVCRRAEREIFRLSRQEAVRPEALKYVNRLSDLLFVLSRWAAWRGGHAEVLWQPQKSRTPIETDKEQSP